MAAPEETVIDSMFEWKSETSGVTQTVGLNAASASLEMTLS